MKQSVGLPAAVSCDALVLADSGNKEVESEGICTLAKSDQHVHDTGECCGRGVRWG